MARNISSKTILAAVSLVFIRLLSTKNLFLFLFILIYRIYTKKGAYSIASKRGRRRGRESLSERSFFLLLDRKQMTPSPATRKRLGLETKIELLR